MIGLMFDVFSSFVGPLVPCIPNVWVDPIAF